MNHLNWKRVVLFGRWVFVSVSEDAIRDFNSAESDTITNLYW